MDLTKTNNDYQALLDTISRVYHQGRNKALKLVDTVLVQTNW